MSKQFTLRAEHSERFWELKERVSEIRGGRDPSNSELVRLMMDYFDPARV